MKIEEPIFEILKPKGRPFRYNFDPFLNPRTEYVILENCDMENYDSIRSCLCRWRRINKIVGQRFIYDFVPEKDEHPKAIVVWRHFDPQLSKKQVVEGTAG